MEDVQKEWERPVDLVQAFETEALSGRVRAESLHPLDKEAFAESLKEQLRLFSSEVAAGYQAIANAALEIAERGISLPGIPPLGKKSMRAVRGLFPTKAALRRVSDPKYVEESVNQRAPLFEVLGLSSESVATMYAISFYLLEQKRSASAAFRLLTVLAPYMADFWIGTGLSLLREGSLQEAREALERALLIDPSSLQALMLICRVLAEQGYRGEAERRLNTRLDEAARKGDQKIYAACEEMRLGLMRFVPGA